MSLHKGQVRLVVLAGLAGVPAGAGCLLGAAILLRLVRGGWVPVTAWDVVAVLAPVMLAGVVAALWRCRVERLAVAAEAALLADVELLPPGALGTAAVPDRPRVVTHA